MDSYLIRVSLAALAITVMAVPAGAQDRPAGTISFSYGALKDTNIDGLLGLGWVADASGRVSRSIDLVGEVGGSYKTISFPTVGIEANITIHTFVGGPRYVTRPDPRVTFFVQGLAGAARASGGISACGGSLPAEFCAAVRDVDVSRTFFTIQPGVGVDFAVAKRAGVRLATDYRAIINTGDDEDDGGVLHEFRFAAGVVFGFGK